MKDNVNHPSHYETGKFECIDVMLEAIGAEYVKGFCLCNAFKYIYRCNKKNEEPTEDIKKANWYLNKFLEINEECDTKKFELSKNEVKAMHLEKEMTIKEFAKLLDGIEYSYNMFTKEQLIIAKENGFVIVYGASDDLVEFDGTFCDEAGGVFDGGIITFDLNGTSDDGEVHKNAIKAFWCGKCKNEERNFTATWEYETDIPHETFMIYEDGEPYCRGIVFNVKDMT